MSEMKSVDLFDPQPHQEPFFSCKARVRLIRGGCRSGKSLMAAVELARVALAGGRCHAVGQNLDHVAQAMWRKLSKTGAFKVVRDRHTGLPRAWRPWEVADFLRKDEAEPADPLIPGSAVERVAWECQYRGVPRSVVLRGGGEVHFFSSEIPPSVGWGDPDFWWLDESVRDGDWLKWAAVSAGKVVWTLNGRRDHDPEVALLIDNLRPGEIVTFPMTLDDNQYVEARHKQEFYEAVPEQRGK
jgi:hypothetical protein